MESSNYTKKMSDLRDRVSKYDQTPKQNHSGIINTTIHNTKPLYFYIAIPCFILLILIICRPYFITRDYTNDDGTVIKKIDYKNLLITVLIVGFILDIGLFMYLKKKVNNKL
jgi:hypothetical protein